MRIKIKILLLLILLGCKEESIYNYSYGHKDVIVHPYELPIAKNPYYTTKCEDRQMLNEKHIKFTNTEKVTILDIILTKLDLEKVLEIYDNTNSLYLYDVCLELDKDVVLNNKIKQISIEKNITYTHRLISKKILYCSINYIENNSIGIFKDTHIDTLYISSKNLKEINFENTTIDVIIPDGSPLLDVDSIIKKYKVKKVYTKEEIYQRALQNSQYDDVH